MKYTRIFHTEHQDVVSATVIQEEGIALVFSKENGITKVKPSAGLTTEVFAGVSLARNVPPAFAPNVEEFIVGTGLVHNLVRAPLAGQCLIKVAGAAKTIVGTAPANNGQVMLVGTTLTFFAGENGKSVFVQYMYEPTVLEAATFVGHAIIGGQAFRSMDTIGMITRGTFSTNYFDASVDWSTALAVRVGVNGKLTTAGTGAVVANATVMNTPGLDDPYLTVRLS